MIEALVLLLIFSAIISASETALFSLTRAKVALFEKSQSKRQRICAELLKSPKNLLVTLLMINISINIAVQNVFSSHLSSSHWFYAILVPFIMTVIFGEILPKSLALCMNEKIAKFMSPTLRVIKFIVTPARWLFLFLAKLILRGVSLKSSDLAPNEKMFAIEKSLFLGLISEIESTILTGGADLSQVKIKEIMRPKEQFIAWDITDSLEVLIEKFTKLECSKIVVFKGSQVLGVLHQQSFFQHQESILESFDVQKHLSSPTFVADTFTCKRVLEMMQSKKLKIALVIDEYSSVIGLVTKEDLVERIVGQIYDKRDEKKLYTRQKDGSLICSGKLLIKDLEDLMHVRIQDPFESTTIGGVLTQIHGDIPKVGAKQKIKDLHFVILGVNEKRVKSLHVFRR